MTNETEPILINIHEIKIGPNRQDLDRELSFSGLFVGQLTKRLSPAKEFVQTIAVLSVLAVFAPESVRILG